MSPASNIQVQTLVHDGTTFVTFVTTKFGILPTVADTHPNFTALAALAQDAMLGSPVDEDKLKSLTDPSVTVAENFEKLSERVSVKGGRVYFDGDAVDGTLEDQIIDFLSNGEDFGPLVKFYEKLNTNPLGDVRAGLYDWIKGQTKGGAGYLGNGEAGALTITEDGDLIGYKSFTKRDPEWRKDVTGKVLTPSRRGVGVVNGIDVARNQFIEQVEGDVVEMPRSKVLHAPSQACGDGLHIGTWAYAASFTGDTVALVRFSPRDIVSLPDSNSTWKLRVCRYTVLKTVTEALNVPVYREDEKDEDPQPLYV